MFYVKIVLNLSFQSSVFVQQYKSEMLRNFLWSLFIS